MEASRASMDSMLYLSFRYSELDWVRAMRRHYASRLRPKLDVVVIAVAALLGVYLWRSLDSRPWGIVMLCLSTILALILASAFSIIPRLVYRREPKFRDEYSLTFSSAGVQFRTVHIDSQLQWSIYSRAIVDQHSFILYYGAHSFSLIPKRVFATGEQLAAFESLLSEKIPEISRKS